MDENWFWIAIACIMIAPMPYMAISDYAEKQYIQHARTVEIAKECKD